MKGYSVVEYLYRDASNYKEYGEILIEGVFSDTDVQRIRKYMYDKGQFFIPEEIGIQPLQPKLWAKYNGPAEDDHQWHSIECIHIAKQEDLQLQVWGTKQQLIKNFQNNWKHIPEYLKL